MLKNSDPYFYKSLFYLVGRARFELATNGLKGVLTNCFY